MADIDDYLLVGCQTTMGDLELLEGDNPPANSRGATGIHVALGVEYL